MELSPAMRLRIAAVAAAGAVLIGFWGWPLAGVQEPFGAVLAGAMSASDMARLSLLALLVGFVGYFLAWPYGREIGVLGVPAGLAVWAVRSGSMAGVLQMNPSEPAYRRELFEQMRWEPVFWLFVAGCGLAGVILAQRISGKKPAPVAELKKGRNKIAMQLKDVVIALIGSVLITQFCIKILAQDVRMLDGRLGSVVGQPATGQIAFAVLVSFGLAAFLVKRFLDISYIWPAASSVLVIAFAGIGYIRGDVPQMLCGRWPAVFFSNSVLSILPVQLVAFGTLGSVAGYWLAVRYNYWRKYQSK